MASVSHHVQPFDPHLLVIQAPQPPPEQVNRLYCQDWNHPLPALKQQILLVSLTLHHLYQLSPILCQWLIHPLYGGVYDSATIISTISTAYDEIVCWRRNNFPVPTGKAGTAFVSELSWLFRAYAEGTALECVALKAITVASILLLQKPHRKSKPREHTSCLERRLQLWSEGKFDDLLNEGKALQGRLPKIHNTKDAEDHLARSFSNLIF